MCFVYAIRSIHTKTTKNNTSTCASYMQVEAYIQKQQEITQWVHVLHICK